MKIVCLLENKAASPYMKAEHGLSLYIETENKKILFDMGQTAAFAENAKMLGISLGDIDFAVLSHGHYDHGGGLARFLEINRHAPVFVREDAFLPHYNGTQKYIGLDPSLKNHPRLIFADSYVAIDDNIFLDSCGDTAHPLPENASGLLEKKNAVFIPDDFRHEQCLLIRENGKTVLFSGCSHKGILFLAERFRPDILIGGFHFSKMPLDEHLKEAALCLGQAPTIYYTCHCTGTEQFRFMQKYMKNLNDLSCGQTIVI